MDTNKEFMVDRDGKRTAVKLTHIEKQQLIEDLNITHDTLQKQPVVAPQPKEPARENA